MIADGSGLASVSDRTTWSTCQTARKSNVGVGVGFVLTGDDPVCCVDLDHCLTGGRLESWASTLLEACPDTWVEVSPSGNGLHVWGLGIVGRGRVAKVGGTGGCEVYDRGRYVTVTGVRFENAPVRLVDLDDWIATLPTSRG